MNKLSFFSLASVALPLICLFIALSLVFYEANRLHQLQDEQKQTAGRLAVLNKTLQDMAAHPQGAKAPTAAQIPQEQPAFLNHLRAYAQVSHIQLVRWSGIASASPAAGTPPSPGTVSPALPPGVTPIASAVEATGQYGDLRNFLYALQRAPRLLNLSAVKWTRDTQWPQTRLSFTLTRYVTPNKSAVIASTGDMN